jgi:hypothetical protein
VPAVLLWQVETHTQSLGNIVLGVFAPVLAKHTKSFNLIDALSVGVDRIQRNFEPPQRQVEQWRQAQITDERAKLIFYAAFVDGKLDAPSIRRTPAAVVRTSEQAGRNGRGQ